MEVAGLQSISKCEFCKCYTCRYGKNGHEPCPIMEIKQTGYTNYCLSYCDTHGPLESNCSKYEPLLAFR